MRNIFYIVHFTLYILSAIMMTGCGLIELDPNDEAKVPTKMYFQPDTVYVMEGDTFQVQPLFEPDSVNNKVLTWGSLNEDVVRLQNDTLIAEQEGWARIIAISVASMAMDSIDVCVMKPWVMPNTEYPYEMVVYADVSVHGQPLTAEMQVAAFFGSVLLGVGTPLRVGDRDIMRFRLYSDNNQTADGLATLYSFWLYDRQTLQRLRFPVTVTYTGETLGSPSQPIELKIE